MSCFWSLTVTEFLVSLLLYLHSTFCWMNVSFLNAFKIPAEYMLTFTAQREGEG